MYPGNNKHKNYMSEILLKKNDQNEKENKEPNISQMMKDQKLKNFDSDERVKINVKLKPLPNCSKCKGTGLTGNNVCDDCLTVAMKNMESNLLLSDKGKEKINISKDNNFKNENSIDKKVIGKLDIISEKTFENASINNIKEVNTEKHKIMEDNKISNKLNTKNLHPEFDSIQILNGDNIMMNDKLLSDENLNKENQDQIKIKNKGIGSTHENLELNTVDNINKNINTNIKVDQADPNKKYLSNAINNNAYKKVFNLTKEKLKKDVNQVQGLNEQTILKNFSNIQNSNSTMINTNSSFNNVRDSTISQNKYETSTDLPISQSLPTTSLKPAVHNIQILAEVPTTKLEKARTSVPISAEIPTSIVKKIVTEVPVIAEVPITTTKQITTEVPVTAEYPVTEIRKVKKFIEVETEIPVTILKTVKQIVEVETEIPVTVIKTITRNISVTTEVPVQSFKQIKSFIPVETTVPVETTKKVNSDLSIETTVPVKSIKQILTELPFETSVPITGEKQITTNVKVDTITTVSKEFDFKVEMENNINTIRENPFTNAFVSESTIIQGEDMRNTFKSKSKYVSTDISTGTHLRDSINPLINTKNLNKSDSNKYIQGKKVNLADPNFKNIDTDEDNVSIKNPGERFNHLINSTSLNNKMNDDNKSTISSKIGEATLNTNNLITDMSFNKISNNSMKLNFGDSCKICKGKGYYKLDNDVCNSCESCVQKLGRCLCCNNTGKMFNNENKKCNCIFSNNKSFHFDQGEIKDFGKEVKPKVGDLNVNVKLKNK